MKTVKIAIALILALGFSNQMVAQELVDFMRIAPNQQTIETVEQQPRAYQMDEVGYLEAQEEAYLQEQKAKREEVAKKETPE